MLKIEQHREPFYKKMEAPSQLPGVDQLNSVWDWSSAWGWEPFFKDGGTWSVTKMFAAARPILRENGTLVGWLGQSKTLEGTLGPQ